MEKLELYNLGRAVPEEAKKPITAGRLKGMTDINPMWRIKMLTEMFGACGMGWWYEIRDKRIENGAGGEQCAFVDIALFYEIDGKTSHPIYGTGGSAFVANEKSGLHTSDECYKMALTDAISVAAKALGIGADVYFNKDRTKYDAVTTADKPEVVEQKSIDDVLQFPKARIVHKCADCGNEITGVRIQGVEYPMEFVVDNTTKTYGAELCWSCAKKRKNAGK